MMSGGDESRTSLNSQYSETSKLLVDEIDLSEKMELVQIPPNEEAEEEDQEEGLPTPTVSRIFLVIGILILASFLFFLALWDIADLAARLKNRKAPALILISLDGTRPEYLDRGLTPNLSKLASTRYSRIVPSFPSVTFPNHYTLVTGVYPETHGIVGNSFYDPVLNRSFSYTSPINNGESIWWKGAEPIWITARKQGLISATCFWPGSEAEHDGIRPNYWKQFEYVGIEKELELIFKWIDRPSSLSPDLITLYIPQIDSAGHGFGPYSSEVNDTLVAVDSKIGELVAGLEKRRILDKTNIVIVSDHGMAVTDPSEKVIFLDDYTDISLFSLLYNGPLVSLNPLENSDIDQIFGTLKNAANNHGHFQVWKHDNIPEKYHYNNRRVGKILLLADLNWMFVTTRKGYDPTSPPFPKGTHGYDIHAPEMFAVFIGSGPYFLGNPSKEEIQSQEPVSNIEIYPLLVDILKIKSEPHNGTGILISNFTS